MTITYNSTGYVRPFGFGRLLFRWRASIWKAIWVELAIWLVVYYAITVLYWSLPSKNKRDFEHLVLDWERYNTNSVALVTFALGFYVSQSYTRWWDTWTNIPWIDSVAHAVNAGVTFDKKQPGQEEKSLMLRRTIIRYLNLASALTYQTISERVGAEYAGLPALINMGLLTEDEAQEILATDFDTHVYFIPITWAVDVVAEARQAGNISDRMHKLLIQRIETWRSKLGNLIGFHWIPLPLVYTHVVTTAVYFHFFIEIIAGQFLDPSQNYEGHTLDWGFPMFDVSTFVVLVGWLKSAELMKHPFGLDEDAFELMWILKRNVDVGFGIVTKYYRKAPKLVRDKFWGKKRPLGESPKRPNVTTLSFGAEHKHITKKMLRKRQSYMEAPSETKTQMDSSVYTPPTADLGSTPTEPLIT